MSESQTIAVKRNDAVTSLVTSGESVFKSITDKDMSENQQKVSNGITSTAGGLSPALAACASFDLAGVFSGTTQVFNGQTLTITSARTKPVTDSADASDAS